MLYVVFDTDAAQGKNGWGWHVGESFMHLKTPEIMHVVEVQADGDELIHIEMSSSLLPFAKGKRVVRWFGDDARFIVANLLK